MSLKIGRSPVVTASPHLRKGDSTPYIMWNVVASLAPIVGAAVWFFGPSALLVIAASVGGAVATERVFGKGGTIADGSAAITGLLLGLTLPAGMPLWMVVLGAVFAIAFGKLIFGGLGYNIFNPALLGRAFLQSAFPVAITTWPATGGSWWALRGDNFAIPLMSPRVADIITSATPLGLMKFEHKPTALWNLMVRNDQRLPWRDRGSPDPDLRRVAGDSRIPQLADSDFHSGDCRRILRGSPRAGPGALRDPALHGVFRRAHPRRRFHGD